MEIMEKVVGISAIALEAATVITLLATVSRLIAQSGKLASVLET